MSNFLQRTKHPRTGLFEDAEWLDDHFGRHRYGVRFADGEVFSADEIEAIETSGVGADVDASGTAVRHWDGADERHGRIDP